MSASHSLPAIQGRNEGGRRGAIPRAPNHYGGVESHYGGVESHYGGVESHYGGFESLRGAEKSQQYCKYFLHYSEFASERAHV